MTEVPRWLQLQGEIDYLYWELEQALRTVPIPTPIERMVDKAVGHAPKLPPEVLELVEQIKARVAEYDALTGTP